MCYPSEVHFMTLDMVLLEEAVTKHQCNKHIMSLDEDLNYGIQVENGTHQIVSKILEKNFTSK